MTYLLYSPAENQREPLHRLVTKLAHALPIIALIASLATIGVWVTRWSGSALFGVVAANLAFVLLAAFFPVRRPERR